MEDASSNTSAKRARETDEAPSASVSPAEDAAPEKKVKAESAIEVSPENAAAIASMMAFYFGDANLRKDRFLKEEQVREYCVVV